jgi:hypothetical protein
METHGGPDIEAMFEGRYLRKIFSSTSSRALTRFKFLFWEADSFGLPQFLADAAAGAVVELMSPTGEGVVESLRSPTTRDVKYLRSRMGEEGVVELLGSPTTRREDVIERFRSPATREGISVELLRSPTREEETEQLKSKLELVLNYCWD